MMQKGSMASAIGGFGVVGPSSKAVAFYWRIGMSQTHTQSQDVPKDSKQSHASGCLTRLVWFVIGNVVMVGVAVGIAGKKGVLLSALDAWFWGVVVVMVIARYVDISRLEGMTASGQPATIRTWRRYVLFLGLVALTFWGGAHGLALL